MTAILVLWWITVLSWAMNSVGIMSLLLQRFPFAASAESLLCGQRQFEGADGTSGTVLNVLLVIPCLLMNVVADEVDRDAVALQHDDQARERFAAVGDEVRGTSQAGPGGSA